MLLSDRDFEMLDSYCAINGFKKSTLICRLIRDLVYDRDQDSLRQTDQGEAPLPLRIPGS